LVVFINPYSEKIKIIVNDPDELTEYYNYHNDEIFVGYNSRHYDQYIFKGILSGYDPKEVNDWIIKHKRPGWQFSSLFNHIELYNYDVAKLNDGGLKTLESYMGNDIRETSVPFDIDRPLTDDEINETIKYCTHDVEQTIEVFMNRKSDFDAHMALITTFGLPLSYISKTQVQLSARILNCQRVDRWDEWDVTFVPTLKLSKYTQVLTWFKRQLQDLKEFGIYNKEALKIDIAGVPHSFGWGGAHGARLKYNGRGLYLHIDVESYYPLLMIKYGFLTRNSNNPEKFKEIYEKRVALKRAGKKAEQAPYKIVINGTFGISKDPTSPAYDPRQANNICINGQLLLIDLIEKLEIIPGFELIQSNTDGLIVKIPDTDDAFNMIDDICYEWEKRTGMKLAFDVITEIYQKDVNNYVFKFENGKIERKGAYVQESNPLKNDLTIVNTALVEYMMNGVPVEETINNCDDLNLFQKVVKVSNKYMCAWHNGKRLQDKTFRVFASTDKRNGYICKQKTEGATLEKFANTPKHCEIYNGKIDENTRINLDKRYYIDLAKKRLLDYGIEV
jgi:DNA polymerase